MGQSSRRARVSARSASDLRSVTVMRAPRRERKRTTPSPPPNAPRPMTVTRWPLRFRGTRGDDARLTGASVGNRPDLDSQQGLSLPAWLEDAEDIPGFIGHAGGGPGGRHDEADVGL